MKNISRRLMQSLTLIFIVIVVGSCSASANPAATTMPEPIVSNTNIPTLEETATPTPESTPTNTPEPTKAPEQIADGLGLRSEPLYEERTFSTKETDGATYLVDEYNNVPKAKLEDDGTWRKLDYTISEDAEVMYGALAPEGTYIREGTMGDANGTTGRLVGPRFLGDWEVRPIDYNGEQINVYYLLAGLRDGGGRLHVVRVAYDSPDIGEHYTTFQCFVGEDDIRAPGSGLTATNLPLAENLAHLRPGERVGLWVYERSLLAERPYYEHPDYPLMLNSRQMDMVISLYNQHPEVFQGMSAGERAGLDEFEWPDRVLTFSASPGLIVSRPTEADCHK